MPNDLPELPYYTLSGLAKARGCSEEDILHYGIAGQLRICALSAGWELQEGYYAPDGVPVPVKERWSNMEPLLLPRTALRKVLSSGEVVAPEFVLEEEGVQDQNEDGEPYEEFLSCTIISHEMKSERDKIVVRKADLVVRKEDAETFLTSMNDPKAMEPKTYDLSSIKPKDRKKLVLEFAAHVWEKYWKEYGNTPKIGYVHNQIEKNENYIRTRKNKSGGYAPSYKTITKEITEQEILKKIQSQKNAEKRG